MGLGTLPTRSDGQKINQTWFNVLTTALIEDVLPRNSSGVVANISASLGNSSFRWLKAFIEKIYLDNSNGAEIRDRGYWQIGDIKHHHSFNGSALIGHGWMLCDGRKITEANYNTEHGAGTWAQYIGTSPLLNKYLPNLSNKYLVGTSNTTQDGSTTITSVGLAGHTANLSHTHSIPNHSHQWFAGGNPQKVYDSAGNLINVPYEFGYVYNVSAIPISPNSDYTPLLSGNLYNEIKSLTAGNSLSSTQTVQPESIQTQIYLRII